MINIFPIAYFSYSLAFPLGNVHPDYVIETFTSILAITLRLSSVSYTHLDVYKRHRYSHRKSCGHGQSKMSGYIFTCGFYMEFNISV